MILDHILAGLNALKEFIALQVPVCLIPAFPITGGIVSFVTYELIFKCLGDKINKFRSFTFATTL